MTDRSKELEELNNGIRATLASLALTIKSDTMAMSVITSIMVDGLASLYDANQRRLICDSMLAIANKQADDIENAVLSAMPISPTVQ